MTWCDSCPNRWIAELAASVGDDELAARIRDAGCNNWKRLEETVRDRETGQPIETRVVERCMRDRLVGYLNDIHMHAALTGKATESHRNVVAEGFSLLAGRPIRGDGRTLPEGWAAAAGIEDRRALAALGDGGGEAGDG